MKYSVQRFQTELKKASKTQLEDALYNLEVFFDEYEKLKDSIFTHPAETKEEREKRAFEKNYSFWIGGIPVRIYTTYEETAFHCYYSVEYAVCSERTNLKRIKTIYELIKSACSNT